LSYKSVTFNNYTTVIEFVNESIEKEGKRMFDEGHVDLFTNKPLNPSEPSEGRKEVND
jgi:hypothetical protein